MWWVVYVNSRGVASIVSGPHREKEDAGNFISCNGDEVWPAEKCRSVGLIPRRE